MSALLAPTSISQKDDKEMSNNDSKSLDQDKDLATEAAIKSILPEDQAVTPCKDKDAVCNKRWIEAFSDCA
jgi:hypothetical protein